MNSPCQDFKDFPISKILIVDDDESVRIVLKKALERAGYSCKDVETFMVGFGEKWFAVYNDDYTIKKEFTYVGILNRKISFKDSKRLKKLVKDMMMKNRDIGYKVIGEK